MAKKCFGVPVAALVFAMVFAACPNNGADDPLNGTWVDDWGRIVIDNGKWELRSNIPEKRGTYSVNGDTVAMATTHVYFVWAGGWVTQSEAENHPDSGGMSFDQNFATLTCTVNGDTLQVEIKNTLRTFTKR